MKLVMYIGLDCIDAVPLNEERISQPGYLGSIKRELLERYAAECEVHPQEPEFLIAQMESRTAPAPRLRPFTNGSASPAAFAVR